MHKLRRHCSVLLIWLVACAALLPISAAGEPIISFASGNAEPLSVGSFETRAGTFRRAVVLKAADAIAELSAVGGRLRNERGDIALLTAEAEAVGPISRGESRNFVLSAALPSPGKYNGELWFDVRSPDTTAQPVRVVASLDISYKQADPGDIIVTVPSKVRITLPGTEAILTAERSINLHAVVENRLNEPIDPIALHVRRVYTGAAADNYDISRSAVPVATCGGANAAALEPRQVCIVRLAVGGLPGPGGYTAVVASSGGRQPEFNVDVNVRRSAFWLLPTVALGLIVGWVVQFWRAGGVDRIDLLARVSALQERIGEEAAKAPEAGGRGAADGLNAEAASLRLAIRRSQKTAAGVDAFEEKALLFAKWLKVRQAHQSLEPAVQDVLKLTHASLINGGFEAANNNRNGFEAWLRDVEEAAARSAALSGRMKALERDIDSFSAAPQAQSPSGKQKLEALKAGLAEASAAFEVRDWRKAAEKLAETTSALSQPHKDGTTGQSALEGIAVRRVEEAAPVSIAREVEDAFYGGEGSSAVQYRRRAELMRAMIPAIAAFGTVLSAYLTLYDGNHVWGGTKDLIVAVLFGAGVGMSATLVLGQLVDRFVPKQQEVGAAPGQT